MKDPAERTKVVVRRLPPTISQPAVMEQIDGRFAGHYDWVFFRAGKISHKGQKHSRVYINFKKPEDVVEFAEFFDGHIFVNEKGAQFKAKVEYAPSQRIPKPWSKKDGREGTISKDPEYVEFLELISKPAEHLPSAEIQLERKEAERGACTKDTIIVTPLMDFVRQKRAAKSGAQRSSASVRLSRRAGGASASRSSPSKRGSDKRRGPTSVYVLRDSTRSGNGKDKPAYVLASKREEQQQQQADKAAIASAIGKEASEVEFASGALEAGKSKILLLKGKEKEVSDASGGFVQQQIASSLKNSPTSTSKQNQRLEASGRIIRSILSKEGRLGLPHAASAQHEQLTTTNIEKDKRPPRPPNMRSSLKDHGSSCSLDVDEKRHSDDKVVQSNTYGSVSISEKHDRRSRNKDRPDRGVWAPLRRSDRSPSSEESLSEAKEASIDSLGSTTSHHSAAKIGEDETVIYNARVGRGTSSRAIYEKSQSPGERKSDLLFANRIDDFKHHGSGRGSVSSMENGSHRHVGRRGLARGSKEVENSSSLSDGKISKRAGYGSHERQVWVQKSGSAS